MLGTCSSVDTLAVERPRPRNLASNWSADQRQPMTFAAVLAVVLVTIVAVFQFALALGAPLGKAAWGGRNEAVLPTGLLIASGLAAIVVYPFIAVYVLASADLINLEWLPTGATGMWVLTGFFTLGTIANLASRSKIERVWAPVSLAIAVCCAIVANGM